MADRISPDPGFAFKPGTEQTGKTWITELIRLVERNASTTLPGRVKKMPLQADSTATTVAGLVIDFNALLAALKAADMMETT